MEYGCIIAALYREHYICTLIGFIFKNCSKDVFKHSLNFSYSYWRYNVLVVRQL